METLNLIDLFEKGGIFMWPLLAFSVAALAALFDRWWFFTSHRYRLPADLESLRAELDDGGNASRIPPKTRDPMLSLGLLYLQNRDASAEHRRNVLQRHARQQVANHERRVRMLATIAVLSPLLGLLGTVWGMVGAFSQIESLGEAVRASDFAGGIWSGLLTTVFGLVIAIPATAGARYFERRVERLADDFNDIVSHLDEWTGHSTL